MSPFIPRLSAPPLIVWIASLALTILAFKPAMLAATVTYTMQTGNFNSLLNERNNNPPYAGTYNNTATEIGNYANGGSFGNTPGAAAFQTFTTTGNGTSGSIRSLQVGDTFTITGFVSANPSAGGYLGISFRDSTTYTNFFSSTDNTTEARFQLDNTGGWKVYNSGSAIDSGLGANADRTFVIKITSGTTFDAQIGGTWYYNNTMAASGGTIDSFAIYTFGDNNANSFWKNASLADTGTVELGYALAGGATFIPGIIADGLAADSTTTARANNVFIGGDAGSQVNLVQANTYTGTTTINPNATGEAQHANALGTTAGATTVRSGGALKLYDPSGISFAAESLTINGTGVNDANGALRNVGGNNTWNGAITLGTNARINADTTGGAGSLNISGSISGGSNVLFLGASGSNITISNGISGSGNTQSGSTTSIFKDGNATLHLTAANSYTGDTRIVGGILNVSGSGNLGSGSDVFISNGAQLSVNTNVTVASVQETGNLNGGTISIASGATFTLNGANRGSFYQNSISGSGNLTMSGSGNSTLNLYGNQTYTGTTSVTAGEIVTTVAMSSSAYSISGGTFSTGAGSLIANNSSIALSGSGVFSLGGNETLGSISATGGTLAINGFRLTTDSNTDTLFGGSITGNSSSSLVKRGTGVLSLTSSNTASGGLYIDNGVVALNGATLGFSGIDIGAGSAGDQSANNATLRVSSALTYSQNIFANNEGTTTGARTINFAQASGTATLGGSVSLEKNTSISVDNASATGVLSGQISGAGNITKSGSGILTLSGNNSAYNAGASVTGGTLLLNNSFGGPVSVASSGTLGGSMSDGQSVGGLVTLNSGATLAPGNSVGTMNFSAGLTLNSTSTVRMEISNVNGSADRINVTGGTLTYAGNLVFDAASMSGITNNTYTLFTGSQTGSWNSVALASGPSPGFTPSGSIWTRNTGDGNIWTYNQSAGTLTVVPEPSTWALIGVGAAFVLWRLRRRRA